MKSVKSPTTPLLLTFHQLRDQLKLDDDAPDRQYVLDLAEAAVEYAEEVMACSLLTKTITATYEQDEPLMLPWGPVQSITTVADARGSITSFRVQRYGRADFLLLANPYVAPLTVVYKAGFGDTPASVPADIRLAIRTHVATLYAMRESVAEKEAIVVPHSLEDFYRLKSRQSLVA